MIFKDFLIISKFRIQIWDKKELLKIAEKHNKNSYGEYLKKISEG